MLKILVANRNCKYMYLYICTYDHFSVYDVTENLYKIMNMNLNIQYKYFIKYNV